MIIPSCFETKKNLDSYNYKDISQFETLSKSLYVDFDTSMKSEQFREKINQQHNAGLFKFLKYRYEINNLDRVVPQQFSKVPKIFHYIWFGVKLPDKYRPFLQTWLKHHPDWTFIFWVDNSQNYDLGTLKDFTFDDLQKYLNKKDREKHIVIDVKNLTFDNRRFFDKTNNYGQRSDILRFEIVYRFGGVYIDVDLECIKSLDILNHMYDFYTGTQPSFFSQLPAQ